MSSANFPPPDFFYPTEHKGLNLSHKPISDEEVIEQIKKDPSLEWIWLINCPNITDRTIRFIATHCLKLHDLDISRNEQITPLALMCLRNKCRLLKQLHIRGLKIDAQVIAAFKTKCPPLKTLGGSRKITMGEIGCEESIDLLENP